MKKWHIIENYIEELSNAPKHYFKYWDEKDDERNGKKVLPEVSAGVYLIYKNEVFLYAGMAGKNFKTSDDFRKAEDDVKAHREEKGIEPPKSLRKGLYDRLNAHSNGALSGDKFCVYIAERFVVPDLTKCRKEKLRMKKLTLKKMVGKYVKEELSYKFCQTKNSQEATKLEKTIIDGNTILGKPLLNSKKSDS